MADMKVKRSGGLLSTLVGCALVLLAAANNTKDDCETTTSKPGPQKYVRLPTSVLPVQYDIQIHLYMIGSDATDFMFKGRVQIHLRCVSATNNITLHASALKVETQTIRFSGESGTVSVPKYTGAEEDKDSQFFVIKLDRNMEAGRNYVIEMNYTAPLEDKDDTGLILKSYIRNNNPVYLAVTNFRPTGARKAFPCFDEPSFKATFNITIIRPEKLFTISNMIQTDRERKIIVAGETYVEDVYKTTPVMSTYAIAFLVSDFNYIYNKTKNGLSYRALASPETLSRMRNALELSVHIHDFFEEFFGINCPLPRLAMVAIPNFTSHAMENWGLLTYSADLFQEGSNKEITEEKIAINLAHAACKQWFGGLVSPAWWDDNWVNEGLCTLMAYVAVDHIKPEWKIFEKFLLDRQFKALSADKGDNAFSLYRKVNYHNEIQEVFKDVIYNKAASIFRMLRHFLGYETFKKGITRYLNKFQYSSANHDELWSALQQQADEDGKGHLKLKAIMDNWTLQEGSPLVIIDTFTPKTVKATTMTKNPNRDTWEIPITFTTVNEPNFNRTYKDVHWLTKNIPIELKENGSKVDWTIANVEMNGYYRVEYNYNIFSGIGGLLRTNHEMIPVMTRAQLIYDVWSLVREGRLTLDKSLRIIRYIDKEREYLPFAIATEELQFFTLLIESSDLAVEFKTFVQSKLMAPYKYFMNTHEIKRHDALVRHLIVQGACHYELQECLSKVHADYRELMTNNTMSRIEPELMPVVLCYGIAAGGDEEWNYALKMYEKTPDFRQKALLLYALSCSKKSETINRYLNLILDKNSVIQAYDGLTVLKYVAIKPQGRLIAWNFFATNFLEIKAKFGGYNGWPTIFNDVMSKLHTASERHDVKIDIDTKLNGSLTGEEVERVRLARQIIDANYEWMEKHKGHVTKWLNDNNKRKY